MDRFSPYSGIAALLFLFFFAATFSDNQTVSSIRTIKTPVTSSTPSVTSGSTTASVQSTMNVSISTPTSVATGPKKKTTSSTPAVVVTTPPKSTPVPSPTSATAAELDASASALRGALVNIICYVPRDSGMHSISGSGVFIDPKGIILTNAHIGQYFLLADRGVQCTIRSGSPAVDKYAAALIYISPAWLHANADVLTEVAPTGTGEHDFALLAITKSETTLSLPGVFPSVPLGSIPPVPNTPVIIASYGAQFLESSQVQSSLFPTIVFGSIKNVYTFSNKTIDILSLGGSAAAQEGSSGGGVTDASGMLVGTITTSTIEGNTDTRSLSAISTSYIRGEYASETGNALDLLLAAGIQSSVANFASRIPALESILTAHLPQ